MIKTAWILSLSSLLTSGLLSDAAASQEDYNRNWPQWRGPTGDGVALQGNPPVEWSEDNNIKWKTSIPGEGHATPIVWGNKVFVLTAVPIGKPAEPTAAAVEPRPERPRPPQGERRPGGRGGPGGRGRGGFGGGQAPTQPYGFTTLCLDRNTGEPLWDKVGRREIPHEGHQRSNTYASGSPVTDGERLISFFGSQGLYCYDLDGNLAWTRDLGKMRTRNGFGEGSSPTLHEEVLVVLWDNEEDSYVYAFNKRTGDELWKRSRDERTGWTTPFVLTHKGKAQVVINGTTAVRSYDLKTGEVLWTCSGQTANAIPSIVADGDSVYALSGYRGNAAMAIRLGGSGDLTETEAIRWSIERGTPYVPSPLLYDGKLYFCQRNNGILTCVDSSTGEPYYSQERVEGLAGIYASPVGARNRIYLASQNGVTAVIENSSTLKILATNQLDAPIDSSPAIAGNELFLRTHTHLYCIAADR